MCLILQSFTLADVETVSKGWQWGGRAGKVCVVAQLHERGKLRRYRLTRRKKGVEGVMGRGGAGREFSQSQLSSNWVEWLRGIGRSWVFCVQAAETVERSEMQSPLFFFSRVCFYSYSDPASPEQSLSSLSLSLFTSLHLSISCSISPSVSVR